ncbi:IS3 family transposase [Mycoplasma simbae]|uniref:IS3 family transposase n=1 Tax=Mycoplasma simbae TaxID=36744 RepID=UPI000495EA83|nr:IS3 family transposase [Mycoplasma simbae]
MSKHLTKEEFCLIYQTYLEEGFEASIKVMYEISPDTQKAKRKNIRKRISKIIKYYNLGMEDKLLTKKGLERKKGSGRPRKRIEPDWNIFNKDELIEIAKRYYEITKDLPIKDKIKESQKINISAVKLSTFFNLCRQTISKHKIINISAKKVKHSEIIKEAFNSNKGRYGREKLSVYIEKMYKISINSRTLGRYLNILGLKCILRQKRKNKEIKDTASSILNIVNRDYNDSLNRNIFATDVTYVNSPRDVHESFVYLSAILNHKTKQVIGFKLSKTNNLDLVLDNLKDIENSGFSNFIIHSDHGFQYTNNAYLNKVNELGGTVSLSRVGNSLDNREIEYWFGILKTELLNHLDYTKISFIELESTIKDYIHWYNFNRIQSNLNWKTPQQFVEML